MAAKAVAVTPKEKPRNANNHPSAMLPLMPEPYAYPMPDTIVSKVDPGIAFEIPTTFKNFSAVRKPVSTKNASATGINAFPPPKEVNDAVNTLPVKSQMAEFLVNKNATIFIKLNLHHF